MHTTEHLRSTAPLPRILRDVLPSALVEELNRRSPSCVEELRLHEDRVCTVSVGDKNLPLAYLASAAQMRETLQRMCGGSLYAYSQTIRQGYLTLSGGIRVGVCGTAATEDGRIIGVSGVTGLIVRIPHRVRVDVSPLTERILSRHSSGGMLIYSPPGVGKTTVLRALAETVSASPHLRRTVVVDTREELRYGLGGSDLCLDLLVGYPRDVGIEIAVRSLGAQLVVCDEIGNHADAIAILTATNCGVPIVASAHASSISELLRRPSLAELHTAHVFSHYVGLSRTADSLHFRIEEHQSLRLP